jgi:hypothetical protein
MPDDKVLSIRKDVMRDDSDRAQVQVLRGVDGMGRDGSCGPGRGRHEEQLLRCCDHRKMLWEQWTEVTRDVVEQVEVDALELGWSHRVVIRHSLTAAMYVVFVAAE